MIPSVMRGHLAGAVVFLFAGIVPATSALAATDFRGGGYLTDFTNCEGSGWSGSIIVRTRVQPAGLIGNNPDLHRLTLTFGTNALNYLIPNTDLSQWVTTNSTQIFAGAGSGIQVQFRLTYLSVPGFTDETTFAQIAFELGDFTGVSGCTVRGRLFIGRN